MRQCNPDISPEHADALWHKSQPTGGTTVTAKCTLITPMYGGGVQAGVVDSAMPIRASALRGQLRFWWRLLYGGGRPPTEVFKDECALWGGISTDGPQASQVAVRVACSAVENSQLIKGEPSTVPDYALILDPKKKKKNLPKLLKQGYKFDVTLEFHSDEKKEQVVEALRWWASFSGVGARTRRGFGAVKVDDAEVGPVPEEEVNKLGGRVVMGPPNRCALAAWHSAIEPLGRFRQGPSVGRGGGSKPGRSNWPEADTIRRVAGKSAHEPRGFYPRAAFGLPIVFHFKDEDDLDDTLEVAGQEQNRMASPLILRPSFDGKAYRSLALLLPGWEERIGVTVTLSKRGKGRSAKAWPDDMDERKRLAAQIAPMKDRGEDALSAFMRYFQDQQR